MSLTLRGPFHSWVKLEQSVRAKKLAFICLVLVSAALIAILVAGSLLTAPAPQSVGELPTDLPGRSIQFPSGSGATIHGWFIPGKLGGGAVVLMHGVRSNRLSMTDRAISFARRLFGSSIRLSSAW